MRIYFLARINTGLLVMLIFISCSTKPDNPDHSLFKEYFKPLPIPKPIEQLGAGQTDIAYRIYHQGDYKEAIVNFKYALIDHPNDSQIKLYLGICFVAAGEHKQANKIFNDIIEAEKDILGQQARWYLALSYLKMGELQSAKSILESILESKLFGGEAKELYAKI